MPTKVSVGLSKKAGLPNYGSVGASCHVELELDSHILDGDPERFRLQVQKAYAACRDSVETELIRLPAIANGMDARHSQPGSNGHQSADRSDLAFRRKQRTATPGQLRVIHGIAARRQIDLDPILDRLNVNNAEDLSVVAASELIAELQQRDGTKGRL